MPARRPAGRRDHHGRGHRDRAAGSRGGDRLSPQRRGASTGASPLRPLPPPLGTLAGPMAAVRQTEPRELDVVIVGAGFSGLYMLHRLRELGLAPVPTSAATASAARGTGTAIPARAATSRASTTAYAFSAELLAEWEWTERYASQPEILRYLDHVADRFDLRRDIQFDRRSPTRRTTRTRTAGRRAPTAASGSRRRFCIMAVGCLSSRQAPRLRRPRDVSRAAGIRPAAWPHERRRLHRPAGRGRRHRVDRRSRRCRRSRARRSTCTSSSARPTTRCRRTTGRSIRTSCAR